MITPDNAVGVAQDFHTISNKHHPFPESTPAPHNPVVLQHNLAAERGAGPSVWHYKLPVAPRNIPPDTSAVGMAASPPSHSTLQSLSQGIVDQS